MKELDYFYINNRIGGSQAWFMDPWMKLGGCAALAAVDSCVYLTLKMGAKKLCPINIKPIDKDKYKYFGMHMKPFISPRAGGVSKLSMFIQGFNNYLQSINFTALKMQGYPMGSSMSEAASVLMNQIDKGYLVPFLLLIPKTWEWRGFEWHWFILGGYKWENDKMFVKAITYGGSWWLSFDGLWYDDNDENGGMILYDFENQ